MLSVFLQLPHRFVVPLPVRVSELLDFDPADWALLDQNGLETFDLPPQDVAMALAVKARHSKLSANDCFCLVTTRRYAHGILLTGDNLLRRVAAAEGLRVHGVLWVVDQLMAAGTCNPAVLIEALEAWRSDRAVFLPSSEVEKRLRYLQHT